LSHLYPEEQLPQFKIPPHPSDQDPQFFPKEAHVAGVHDNVHTPLLHV
jgi:hypothetical protein